MRAILYASATVAFLAGAAPTPAASGALPFALPCERTDCASQADTLILFGLGPSPLDGPYPDDAGFAAGKPWFIDDQVISFQGRRYAKFGWPMGPRPSRPGQQPVRAVLVGEYDGVPVYGQPPVEPYPRFILVRLDADGRFQPYAEASEVQ